MSLINFQARVQDESEESLTSEDCVWEDDELPFLVRHRARVSWLLSDAFRLSSVDSIGSGVWFQGQVEGSARLRGRFQPKAIAVPLKRL